MRGSMATPSGSLPGHPRLLPGVGLAPRHTALGQRDRIQHQAGPAHGGQAHNCAGDGSYGRGDHSATPLLFRADSGFDSAKLMRSIGKQAVACKREIAFIIKCNPRITSVETIAKDKASDARTTWTPLRHGKRQCVWAQSVEVEHGGDVLAVRRVYRLTERTINKRGQPLLLPEYVLEGGNTTLPTTFTPEQTISLVCGSWYA